MKLGSNDIGSVYIGSTAVNKIYIGSTEVWTSFTGLLDTYPNAAAAYSLRLLSSTYSGDAIRVRRASDNAETNIGFVSGELDTTTLETFCSGTNGYVTTWYDQSGNGYDATQSTSANQPQIVSSGSTILENGKPALSFDGSDDWMNSNYSWNNNNYTIFTIAQNNNVLSGRDVLWGILDSSNSNRFYYSQTSSNWEFVTGDGNNFVSLNPSNNQLLHSNKWEDSSNQLSAAYNGNTYITNTNSTNPIGIDLFIGTFNDGLGNPTGTVYFGGKYQELILYPSDQSSNRTGISDNINSYYSIY